MSLFLTETGNYSSENNSFSSDFLKICQKTGKGSSHFTKADLLL